MIVCDTNIWYEIACGNINLPDDSIFEIPITVIEEIALSPKQEEDPELITKTLRAMMKKGSSPENKIVNYVEPFHYFITIDTFGRYHPKTNRANAFLEYTSRFANNEVPVGLIKDTRELRISRRKNLDEFAQLLNSKASKIKCNLITKKEKYEHSIYDTSEINKSLIKQWVEHISKIEISREFQWQKVELFMSVLNVFFKSLEQGKTLMTKNDISDLFNLIYVQPEKLYWTRDMKWINLIKKAGMEKYLFQE